MDHVELHGFGDERVEAILGKLSSTHITTLLRNPEDAVVRDIPNLVFFNTDLPANHTVRVADDGELHLHTRVRRKSRWRPLVDPYQLLTTCLRHFCKFVDHARTQRITSALTPIEVKLLNDYISILDSLKDFQVSPHYPGYATIATFSCLDEEKKAISISAVVAAIVRVVRENCSLPKEDWVQTLPYAAEALT